MQEVFYTVIEWLFWIGIFIVFYTYLGYGTLLYVLVKVKELFKKPISIGLPSLFLKLPSSLRHTMKKTSLHPRWRTAMPLPIRLIN